MGSKNHRQHFRKILLKIAPLLALMCLLLAACSETQQADTAPTADTSASPLPSPSPVHTLAPPPGVTPVSTPIPAGPSLDVLWGIEQSRVFTVSELKRGGAVWVDKEPIVMRGCRLGIDAPTKRGRAGVYGLFSEDGQYSPNHYLVFIGGPSSLKGGFQKGQCYELVATFEESFEECFFFDVGVPRDPFAPCPSDGLRQRVPSFKVHSEIAIVDGKLTRDGRENVRAVAPLP